MSKAPLLAAIAWVALFITGTAFLGTPLRVDASPAEAVGWLQEHHSDVPVAVATYMVATIPFFVLVAWTRRALPDIYGYAFLGAAGAFVAQASVSWWLLSGAALHAASIEPATARALMDVWAYFGPVLTTTDVVMAGAVAMAAFQAGALPRWFGWLSALFAMEQLIEVATVYGDSGFGAPGGDWNNVVGAALLAMWILGLGVALSRRSA
jgi:type IV secretory pathway protease TraF